MLQKKRIIRRLKYFLPGIFCGAAAMFLILYFAFPGPSAAPSEGTATAAASDGTGDSDAAQAAPGQNADGTVACPEEQLKSDGWELTLISREHPLSHSYVPESLSDIGSDCTVDSRIAGSLEEMLSDARSEGFELSVISGYRSYERQTDLFAEGMTERISQGLSPAEAYNETVRSVTLPGTSEHAAGLAVDITASSYPVLEESQADMPEQQWLMAHCYEYGFILRYPEGSEDITGITYEPWHYRYVGTEAAAKIHSLGITLEEYLQDD